MTRFAIIAVFFLGLASARAQLPPGAEDIGPRGTLTIRAVQGTKGAAPVGVADVEVDLYHDNQPFKRLTARLDEHGVAVINDLPVAVGLRPVARVKYAGVMYQDMGPQMDVNKLEASMEVTVYEVTDAAPAWRIAVRQIAGQPSPESVDVAETLIVENTGDRTWLGAPPGADGRRNAVVVTLPAGAVDVHLDAGFHGWCCTSFADRSLCVQMPLMPGRASFHYSYRVPAVAGRADLRVWAPVPVDHAMFFVPDDGTPLETVGVEASGTDQIEGTTVRLYHAKALAAGAPAGLVLTGLVMPAPAADPSESLAYWTKVVAGAALGLVLLGGGVRAYLRSPSRLRRIAG